MAVTVRALEAIRDVPREAWDALHGETDSPFVEWEWLDALESTGCAVPERGWIPRHLVMERDGLLVAAMPAYIKTNSEGEFVFDHQWAGLASRLGLDYYPKLIAAAPFTPATGARILTAPGESVVACASMMNEAAHDLATKLDLSSIHVLFPHEAHAYAFESAGLALRLGVQFHWHNEGYSDFESFLRRFPSKRRTAIRRERAQLERDGDRIETVRGDAITQDLVSPMFAFYKSTVEKFSWGRQYLRRAFFTRIVERFRHRLEWVIARDRAGEPIAGAFNLRRGPTTYGRYWGARIERKFLHFHVCFYHGIDDAIRHGVQTFEPGAGGEHKRSRGFEPTITYSAHTLLDTRMDRIVREFLAREAPAVRAWVADERAQSPLRNEPAGEVPGGAQEE